MLLRMIRALRERLASLSALSAVFRNRDLRRLEVAWAGSVTAFWAYTIALGVYAHEQGGATAVGLVVLIRMAPAAIAAPFVAGLGDRFRRELVLFAVASGRAAAMGGAALAVFADAPVGLIYGLAGLEALVQTMVRPTQAALLPQLAKTPEELTAANVAASTVESLGISVGPAVGGILLAVTSPGTTFAVTAGVLLFTALLVALIKPEAAERRAGPSRGILAEAFAGFHAIGSDAKLRLIVGLYGAQTLVAGALNVLIVVSALELLDVGESGVGFLQSAVGVGGILGGLVALALAGRQKLAFDFGAGLVLWGAPIALIGFFPHTPAALFFLGIAGLGVALGDVAGVTLLQRAVDDEVLARVFGVVQGVFVGTIGLGGIIAPALISLLGIRGALIATGALMPVLTLLLWSRLSSVDASVPAPERELALLHGVPFFAPLPPPALEHLASSLIPVRVEAGHDVFRQGDRGDRFYVVREGEVEIDVDGRTSVQGPGSYFGEIALMRDVPRTATVRAHGPVELYALERDDFLGAVTGHAESREAADSVIGARLGPAGFAST
jgi:MFS family permease